MKRFIDGFLRSSQTFRWLLFLNGIEILIFVLGFMGYLEGFDSDTAICGLGYGMVFIGSLEFIVKELKEKNRQAKTQ